MYWITEWDINFVLQLRVITEQTGIIHVALWNYSEGKLKNKGQQESSLSTWKELSFPLIEARAVLFCFFFPSSR